MNPAAWMPAPLAFALPVSDQVHVWRAQISVETEQICRDLLAPDELQRARLFWFPADRRRYIVTRAILRSVLGKYLDLAPRSLSFVYNEFGKPSLGPSCNSSRVTFNVSHSGDYALLAFGMAIDVGVDLEQLHGDRNIEDLAKAVLPLSDYHLLMARPAGARNKAFLQSWTRREAVGKALGGGFATSSGRFEFQAADACRLSIANIEAGDHYVAALAARARNLDARLWNWAGLVRAVESHRDPVMG
jgi:4'-phosphopantetheinyl transferase